MHTLSLEKMNVSFGSHHVLRDLSLELRPGVWALVGPNGSGKSTMLKALWGELPMESGILRADGCEPCIPGSDRWKLRIAAVPDDDALFGTLSARDNLRLWGSLNGLSPAEETHRSEILLQLLGLESSTEKLCADDLSRGTRKRLALAMALQRDAELFLMDEPFSGLDAQYAMRLADLLTELGLRKRIVLFSCHTMDALSSCATACVRILDGRLEPASLEAPFDEMQAAGVNLGRSMDWIP